MLLLFLAALCTPGCAALLYRLVLCCTSTFRCCAALLYRLVLCCTSIPFNIVLHFYILVLCCTSTFRCCAALLYLLILCCTFTFWYCAAPLPLGIVLHFSTFQCCAAPLPFDIVLHLYLSVLCCTSFFGIFLCMESKAAYEIDGAKTPSALGSADPAGFLPLVLSPILLRLYHITHNQ